MTFALILTAFFHVALWLAFISQKLNRATLMLGLSIVAAVQVAGIALRLLHLTTSWWVVLLPTYLPLFAVAVGVIASLVFLLAVCKILTRP